MTTLCLEITPQTVHRPNPLDREGPPVQLRCLRCRALLDGVEVSSYRTINRDPEAFIPMVEITFSRAIPQLAKKHKELVDG